MQKNIFKKIASGLCATVMSFGICLAEGPFSPPENITVDIFTNSDCYYEYENGTKTKITPTGVMIRSYNTPYDELKSDYNKRTDKSVKPSVHMCADQEQVYVCLPFNARGWHCGGTCNDTHLSIMMIEPAGLQYSENKSTILTPPKELTEEQKESFGKTYATAVWMTAFLANTFGMNLEEKLTVLGHCEAYEMTPVENRGIREKQLASNMSTPNQVFPLFGLSMDQFRQDVKDQVNYWKKHGLSKHETELTAKMFADLEPYTVQ